VDQTKSLAQENAIMAEIGRIISSTPNIEDVYELFAQEVRKIIPFDRIVINHIDVGKETVVNLYLAGKGISDRTVGTVYPLLGSGNAEMVQTQKPLLIQTETFEEYKDHFPMLLSTFQAGFKSILNIPLFSKGNIIGGLLLRSCTPFAYSEKDVSLAERVGHQIAGAIAIAQLIKQRRQAEQALQKSEERFRELFDHAPVGYHEYDIEGRITNVNRTELDMLGYPLEERLGQFVWSCQAEKEESRRSVMAKLAGLQPLLANFELTMIRKDGTTFPVLIQDQLLRDESGSIIGIRATIQDISERKKQEEEREKLVQELREALANIKTLKGMLPICANCKKIRDDRGYWNKIEIYIRDHSEAQFTHGICPECMEKIYGDVPLEP
jgi:PAS domain S-box-containing protein